MPCDEDHQPPETDAGHALLQSRQEWLKENRNAIDHYNKRVEEHEVFSNGLRSF